MILKRLLSDLGEPVRGLPQGIYPLLLETDWGCG
jgi:hypothetical protein